MPESIDAKKINTFVIDALDNFGKKKWGIGGCLIKGRNYQIYSKVPTNANPEWIIISNKKTLEAKAQSSLGKNVYKCPGYTVVLNLAAAEILGYISLMVKYGGYSKTVDYEAATNRISIEFSETALEQALSEILTNDYEPHTLFDYEIEPPVAKRVR